MLTEAEIKALKPKDKRYRVADGHSLFLDIKTSGIKTWLVFYSQSGKQHVKALGQWPEMSLKQARVELSLDRCSRLNP